jgi:hypothetical protein
VTAPAAAGATRSTRSTGWLPVALLALVLIPVVAGSLPLVELSGGPQRWHPAAGRILVVLGLAVDSATPARRA